MTRPNEGLIPYEVSESETDNFEIRPICCGHETSARFIHLGIGNESVLQLAWALCGSLGVCGNSRRCSGFADHIAIDKIFSKNIGNGTNNPPLTEM